MKIALASDHAGYSKKGPVARFLRSLGHRVLDLGTHSEESVDYPDFARAVAGRVGRGRCQRGVLICGTGIGMAMAANKVPGVRAAVIHSEWEAEMSRRYNDANVACFGQRQQTPWLAERFLKVFLATEFEGGRHQRRVEKMCGLDGSAKPAQWAAGGEA